MLWFEGAGQVHGLFQFLFLEGQRMHGPDCDLPILLAPVPFLGAEVHSLRPSVRPWPLQVNTAWMLCQAKLCRQCQAATSRKLVQDTTQLKRTDPLHWSDIVGFSSMP